jgi:FkbM family methyltransferase
MPDHGARARLAPLANRVARRLSGSRRAVGLAALARNQANMLIGYQFARSPDARVNGELWLARQVAPHVSTFVDVGAHAGDWSAALLELAPEARGVMFEPSPVLSDHLRARFAGEVQVEVVQAAVADASGTAQFYDEGSAGQTSSLVAGASARGAVEREVEVVTLDEALAARGIDEVELLKVDAEGVDLAVMRGARRLLERAAVGVVQFEYDRSWRHAGATLAAAYGYLEPLGYSVFALRPEGLAAIDLDLVGEFFSYANFVALGPRAAGWVGGGTYR